MDILKSTIDAAYQKDIAMLYKVLSQVIFTADNDQDTITAAEERFKKGLVLAKQVRESAIRAAGL